MKCTKIVVGIIVLGFMGLMIAVSPGYADFYKWVDENGTVWLTDDPLTLPADSRGAFETIMADEETSESPSEREAVRSSGNERWEPPAVGSNLESLEGPADERKKLEEEISGLEADIGAARRGLKRVPLTDRRGYWYVIDPATGSKVRATYKDPGAIWSNATWPALPRSARTMESEERRRIESDMAKFEEDLNRAKQELFRLSRR